MKIAILGFGLQGRSVYEFYNSPSNQITICDQFTPDDLPVNVELQSGESYLTRLDRFDLIFRSPVIHPDDIVRANDRKVLEKVTTNTNEFMRLCPSQNTIGITGTKGKGTTSFLIARMLEALGKKVHLGGNIGIPPLDLLKNNIQSKDYVVLELANFQLIDFKYRAHIALCLLIEPEHLDWHSDLDQYYRAKTELFRHQTKEDIAIYYSKNDNSKRIASTGPAKLIPYFESPGALVAGNHIVIDGIPIIRINEIKLLGAHNLQNICAAVTAVWQIENNEIILAQVIRDFEGLPYRLEMRKDNLGIKYFNDSFASAPTATIAAIDSIRGNKVLIIGGKDRKLDLTKLIEKIKNNINQIKQLIIIGEASNRIENELKKINFENYIVVKSEDMNEIVKLASSYASSGDSVILSPGFPSFDMFKNFEDRGNQFNEAVAKL